MSRLRPSRRAVMFGALGLAAGAGAVGLGTAAFDRDYPALPFAPRASGDLLRLAAIRDTRALVSAAGATRLSEAWSETFRGPAAAAGLPLSPHALELLADARDETAERTAAERLALPLGFMLHRAVEQRVRAHYLAAEIPEADWPDGQAMQNAEIAVAALGRRPVSETEARRILDLVDHRARIGFHTFQPRGEILIWWRRFVAWDAAAAAERAALARAMAAPDAARRARFVLEPDLFDPADAIVAAARGGTRFDGSDPGASIYAAALADCFVTCAAVEDFLAGGLNLEAFYEPSA